MIIKVPWTKTMLEKFIDEALLTEDEDAPKYKVSKYFKM